MNTQISVLSQLKFLISLQAVLSLGLTLWGSTVLAQAPFANYQTKPVTIPGGTIFEAFIALTPEQKEKGLSGVKPEAFPENAAMIFPFEGEELRFFWMPDTHFDLSIFYLNSQKVITHIQRKVKHYPKRDASVPKLPGVKAMYVLEMRDDSPIGKQLKVGDHLQFSL